MASLVRQARIAAGLTIEQAAKRLGIPGGYLSEIETGKRQVSAARAEQIANLYGVKREEIFSPSRFAIRKADTA
ncbi:helix-turn-helix transcriptional regulator [Alicyclobacillus macrosporangiidus]|uniref:helix-turn-helix transcriptional regulator n=1 Tax=Alicyclobacillus macrosporangiidus TaxID=392015 RepID=UPI0004975E05|nr:helix-turn-helix transcriptional regulator [Alicyclobacillus macrosporangiidus]